MIGFNLSKSIVIVMIVLLALGSHSTVEAIRRDEIKGLIDGANFAEPILRAKMDSCTSCTSCSVGCSQGCNSCTADANFV